MKGNIGIDRMLNRNIMVQKWPQLVRIRWLLAGVIVILLIASGILSINGSMPAILLVDGNPIAVVTGENQVNEIIEKTKSDLEKEYGVSIIGYNNSITFDKNTTGDSGDPLSESELSTLIKDKLEWQADCWAISINGNTSLYLCSQEEAQQTIDGIKQYYLPSNDPKITVEDISFNGKIEIINGQGPVKALKTPEAAVEAMAKGLDKIVQHTVESGDTLWTIAHANDMTVAKLREINPEQKGDLLKLGQKLNLVKSEPLLTVSSVIVTMVTEKIPYKTTYESDADMWRGQQKVKQSGVNGEREVTYRIKKANDIEVDKETMAEKVLLEPVDRIVIQGTKMMVASRGDGGSGLLGWPLRGRLTSLYGYRGREFHTGLDIDGVTGDPIFAAEDGVVLSAGWCGNYGRLVTIDHGNGLSTCYGHLSSISVSIGQKVTRGTIIGKCGSSGRSTGSHLHFEVRVNGKHRNPLNYLER